MLQLYIRGNAKKSPAGQIKPGYNHAQSVLNTAQKKTALETNQGIYGTSG